MKLKFGIEFSSGSEEKSKEIKKDFKIPDVKGVKKKAEKNIVDVADKASFYAKRVQNVLTNAALVVADKVDKVMEVMEDYVEEKLTEEKKAAENAEATTDSEDVITEDEDAEAEVGNEAAEENDLESEVVCSDSEENSSSAEEVSDIEMFKKAMNTMNVILEYFEGKK